ncbi:adenosylcobalamin/alpha-ribazole phosphatase [Sodalis sp. dw_96]|uniref:adenosylcobalamin/alpha-ribazole phosphatase n=1 Tax=Sodalis sp. dw_96 TaxID=2719794 RepID=UPI001BD2F08F|nr:adenosylcobalamin/alpha-ribazole phosphatase [Sodalis sp. dw_96]
MNLYLVRHGETQANYDGVYCGLSDISLTQNGRWQSQHVAWQLSEVPFDRILVSALRRTRETATILRPDQQPESSPEWNEMAFGEWELRHHHDLRRDDPERYRAWCDDWQHAVPPGGDSFQDFSRRVMDATKRLIDDPQTGNILLVAHQGVLSILLATLLGLPPDAMWHFRFRQNAFSQVTLTDGFCVVTCLNDSGRKTAS